MPKAVKEICTCCNRPRSAKVIRQHENTLLGLAKPRKSKATVQTIYASNSSSLGFSDAPEPSDIDAEAVEHMEFDPPSRSSTPSSVSSRDYNPSSSSDSDDDSPRVWLGNDDGIFPGNAEDGLASGLTRELDEAAIYDALSDELEAMLDQDDSDSETEEILEEIELGESSVCF